ncbi:DUF6212 domain-containing protein [Terrihabitans sp. B22-R8]|uniref:DUF6212 domain-containing protein n=1 Tax=Terrihabitans sp. B22-R8 TaxID=3425128 RepID=UPI00403CFE47
MTQSNAGEDDADRSRLFVDLSRQLAALRREHGVLQNAMADTETRLQALGLLPFHLAFSNPVGRPLALADGTADTVIRQELPVSSLGFAAFALHFPQAGGGVGHVVLRMLEDDQEIAAWPLPPDASGWTPFALRRAIAGTARSLILEVRIADAKNAPLLSLSTPHPIPAYCAGADGGTALPLDAPLAMRIWTGSPGFAVAPLARGRADVMAVRREITASDLSSLVQLRPAGSRAEKLVRYDNASGGILCLPQAGQRIIGALPAILPADTIGVSADIVSQGSGDARFALAVGPSVEEAIAALSRPQDGACMSGWLSPAPDGTGRLALSIPAGSAARTLVLAAELVEGGTPPRAAFFHGFRIEL